MIVAVIPVKGRHSLLVWTVDRLKEINKIDKIILVGNDYEAEQLALALDVEWLHHPNNPLGMKYNAGYQYAMRKYNPDHYILMGASDWFSPNWVEKMLPYLDMYDMVVKHDKHYYNIGRYYNRLLRNQKKVVAGTGAIVSGKIVKLFKGRPFNDVMDNDLDWSIVSNIKDEGGQVGICKDEDALSLSISYHKWGNSYSFDGYWNNRLDSDQMGDGSVWLRDNFPEAINMTLW